MANEDVRRMTKPQLIEEVLILRGEVEKLVDQVARLMQENEELQAKLDQWVGPDTR